jgi:hypothetical protein
MASLLNNMTLENDSRLVSKKAIVRKGYSYKMKPHSAIRASIRPERIALRRAA